MRFLLCLILLFNYPAYSQAISETHRGGPTEHVGQNLSVLSTTQNYTKLLPQVNLGTCNTEYKGTHTQFTGDGRTYVCNGYRWDALLPQSTLMTMEPTTYYVETTGDDTNDCISVLTPCATLQATLEKVPKRRRHPVTIQLGLGNFSGAYVSGYDYDPLTSSGAYMVIQGVLVDATLTSGPVTGTFTSAGTGAWPSWCMSTASWTSGNLRGKLVEIVGGKALGSIYAIEDNTSTCFTPATGSSTSGPDTTSSFRIRTWGTHINSGPVLPKSNPSATLSTTQNGLFVGSMPEASNRTLTVQMLSFDSPLSVGMRLEADIMPNIYYNNFAVVASAIIQSGSGGIYAWRNVVTTSTANQPFISLTSQIGGHGNKMNWANGNVFTNTNITINGLFMDVRYGGYVEASYNSMRCSGYIVDIAQRVNITGDRMSTCAGTWNIRGGGVGELTLTDVAITTGGGTAALGLYGNMTANILGTTSGTCTVPTCIFIEASSGAMVGIASTVTATAYTSELRFSATAEVYTLADLRATGVSGDRCITKTVGTKFWAR